MRAATVAAIVTLVAAACADDDPADADAASAEATSTTAPNPTTTVAATTTTQPMVTTVAPNGRTYPAVATEPVGVGLQLASVEQLLRIVEPTDPAFADLAHEQQMIYRTLGRNTGRVPAVL